MKLEGEVYRSTLHAFVSIADRLQLVLRPDLGLGPAGCELLKSLQRNLLHETKASEWPGTILLDDEADILEFRYDHDAAMILGEAASSFHDWVQPQLPEDPSLWVGKRPVLLCVSHEAYVGLDLTELEEQRLRMKLGFEL